MHAPAAMRAFAATAALALVAAAALAPTQVRPTDGGAPWTPDETAQLRTAIDAQLAAAPTLRGAHVGIVALDARDGSVLYAKNADDYVRPASTMKLLTGSFALDTLGVKYRFTSLLYAQRTAAFFLYSGNNPFLRASDIIAAGASARALYASSESSGGGAIALSFGDTGPNAADAYRDGWTADDFPFAYAAPIEPIIVDENAVRVELKARVSDPTFEADLTAIPNPRCPKQSLLEVRHQTWGSAIAPSVDSCGSVVVWFRESEADQTWHLAIADPAGYAAALFRRGIEAENIIVKPRNASALGSGSLGGPAFKELWRSVSPPLGVALQRCWYPSDNLIAEKLLDEAVRVSRDHASADNPSTASDRGAFAPELAWAKAKPGIALTDDRVADGSGMSQYDRLTANELAAILAYDWKSPNRGVVLDALPVAAVSGTLESQYVGTPIAGRAFAKSGSMLHTSNLAGYLATKNHGTVIFAFMVDDWVGDDDDLLPLRGAILGRFVDAP